MGLARVRSGSCPDETYTERLACVLRLRGELLAFAFGLTLRFERLREIDEFAVVLFVDHPVTF